MYKFAVGLLTFLMCSIAIANSSIRVTGMGSTFAEAREDAFRQAIETKVKSVVVSQREHRNNNTTKNDVLVHSAGYVSSYQIVSSYVSNKIYYVTMDVVVNPSHYADRILSNMPQPQLIDGYDANASYRTAVQARDSWNKIEQMIMDDYPRRAFNIDQGTAYTSLSNRNTLLINIPYTLTWNTNYLNAFEELLSMVSDGRGGFLNPRNTSLFSFVGGSNSSYIFANKAKTYNLQKMMLNKKHPQLFVTVKSRDGNILGNLCTKIEGSSTMLYNLGDPSQMAIYVRNIFQGKVTVEFEYLPEDFYDIELQVLPYQQCMALARV